MNSIQHQYQGTIPTNHELQQARPPLNPISMIPNPEFDSQVLQRSTSMHMARNKTCPLWKDIGVCKNEGCFYAHYDTNLTDLQRTDPEAPSCDIPQICLHPPEYSQSQQPPTRPRVSKLNPTALRFDPCEHFQNSGSTVAYEDPFAYGQALFLLKARQINAMEIVIRLSDQALLRCLEETRRSRKTLLPEGNWPDEIEAVLDGQIQCFQLIMETRATIWAELEKLHLEDLVMKP
ncbi:hypothetical protein MMC06_006253 [Schaereria dolodes]|nr:hypothetical protein [Schaereria dolodes]